MSEDIEKLRALGPIVRMRVPLMHSKRRVPTSPFPCIIGGETLIDSWGVDKEALMDSSQSDMPLMIMAVRAGFFSPPEIDFEADHELYTWRRLRPIPAPPNPKGG